MTTGCVAWSSAHVFVLWVRGLVYLSFLSFIDCFLWSLNDPDRLSFLLLLFGLIFASEQMSEICLRYARETCGSWRKDGFLITRMNAP